MSEQPGASPEGRGPRAPVGPPTGPTSTSIDGQAYRHTVDIRFVLPVWLGNHYVDLRIGRNQRAVQRPHIIPRRVRTMNRVALTVFGQMVAAWLLLVGMAFYWSTQTACGTAGGMLELPNTRGAAQDDRYVLGAPEYVDISEADEVKVAAARALIGELGTPDIQDKLETSDLYFADRLYLAMDRGRSYDGVALPLGNRIVLWREYVESADVVSLATLYVHELQHLLQTPEFVGTAAGESEAVRTEQSFLGGYQAFTGTEAFVRWAEEQALPEDMVAAARSLPMARSADGGAAAPEPFMCGHASDAME